MFDEILKDIDIASFILLLGIKQLLKTTFVITNHIKKINDYS